MFVGIVMLLLYVAIVLSVTHIDGLVQDHNNSIANTLKLLQSCTKPSVCMSKYSYVRIICFLYKYKHTIYTRDFTQINFVETTK